MMAVAPRALVVACNFPPDAAVGTMRTLRLVRHLTANGWGVDVVTISEDGYRPGTIIDAALVAKVPSAVTVVRAKPLRPFERLGRALQRRSPAPRAQQASPSEPRPAPQSVPAPPSLLRRVHRLITAAVTIPDREASWVLPAVWTGWRHARTRRPDVVYSSGPPFSSHLVGGALAASLGVPWVADFRDPWARAPWREDRFAFERRAWAVLERAVVRRADRVVFVTDTNRQDFSREYGPAVAARFSLVPNGCDLRDFEGLQPNPGRHGGRFVLLHAGSLYGARNPAILFRALAAAIANGRIDPSTFRVRFIGRLGIPGVDLPALVRELGLASVVEFVAHVPRRDGLQEMLDASALLIVQPVTTVSIPAKLYEYMAAGRPILALAEPGGETADLVARAAAGIVVRADDQEAMADGLASLVRLSAAGFAPVHRHEYDGDARAEELRQVLAAVTGGRQDAAGAGTEPSRAPGTHR